MSRGMRRIWRSWCRGLGRWIDRLKIAISRHQFDAKYIIKLPKNIGFMQRLIETEFLLQLRRRFGGKK